MTETYQFEELDPETRHYLTQARESSGKGMPGIFAEKPNYLPIIGVLVGFCIVIATVLATFPPTLPPTQEAMLQTAGFMLGGWMILAAMRVWMGGKSGRYAGHFIYADAENLYEGNGGSVQVTGLTNMRDATSYQNHNNGKYQSTDITIKIPKERRIIRIDNQERGVRVTAFLNALCYMREGGDRGDEEELKQLPPEMMGAIAKQVARTGEFPKNLADAEEAGVAHIPRPRREGRRSTGLLAMFAILLAGTAMFFGFRNLNPILRDETAFAGVQSLPQKDQPPALRLYLSNPDFTAHRDEAQQMLSDFYERSVQANVNGTDDEMKRGFSDVVRSLAAKPQAVVSLIVAEEQSPAGQEANSTARESKVQKDLADKWGSTIGDELVVFAAPSDPDKGDIPDKTVRGMIDVRWKFTADGGLEYTIQFRTSPDEEPVVSKQSRAEFQWFALPANGSSREQRLVQTMTDNILQKTVGTVKTRPPVVVFDS